jgi:hypothetical protein
MRQAIWAKTSTNNRKKTPATSRKTIPPTRVKGLRKPPTPRATLPDLRAGIGLTGVATGVRAAAAGCTGVAWAPASRSPAMRPATRTPAPRTRPIFCGLITFKMVTRGLAVQATAPSHPSEQRSLAGGHGFWRRSGKVRLSSFFSRVFV